MNIEEEIFNTYEVNKDKLIEYGFINEGDKLQFKKNILDNKFTIIVEYDKKIKGKIIEVEFNDEYTNFRRKSLGEFNSDIKQKFIDLLIDIRNNCCEKDVFKFPQTRRINDFINKKYGLYPEFLWEKLPNYAVYRKIKKWFAVVGSVSLNKVDKSSNLTKEIEVINLKVKENELNQLLDLKGYYEAFHMNKKNWISIILDDTLQDSEIIKLIEQSYNIVNENIQ